MKDNAIQNTVERSSSFSYERIRDYGPRKRMTNFKSLSGWRLSNLFGSRDFFDIDLSR